MVHWQKNAKTEHVSQKIEHKSRVFAGALGAGIFVAHVAKISRKWVRLQGRLTYTLKIPDGVLM